MIRLNTTLFVTLLAFILLVFLGCEVEQTQEGELPDVDVSVEEGQAPAYDVDWANVDVGMTEKTVTVPKVVVVQEEETIQVPRIDVDLPDEEEIERTITVETEVRGEGHELEIQNVYAVNDRLIVVSRLEETGESLGDQAMRVADRIVLNAPDFDVRHYIIGDRPEGAFNEQYTYINSLSEIDAELQSAHQIYGS